MKRKFNANIRSYASRFGEDYYFKTALTTVVSLMVGFIFLIYNGLLGIIYGAVWNISICIYYIVLLALKLYILLATKKAVKKQKYRTFDYRKKVFHVSFIILTLLDFVLFAPIIDMALGHRNYTFGLIPAISMAVYTTYRVITSIIHYRKSRKADNLFLLEVRTVDITDSLVSVLTLQNALIIAMGGYGNGIRMLTFCSTVGVLILIVGITMFSYYKGHKLCTNHAI